MSEHKTLSTKLTSHLGRKFEAHISSEGAVIVGKDFETFVPYDDLKIGSEAFAEKVIQAIKEKHPKAKVQELITIEE